MTTNSKPWTHWGTESHPAHKVRGKCYFCEKPAVTRRQGQLVCKDHAEAIDDGRLYVDKNG